MCSVDLGEGDRYGGDKRGGTGDVGDENNRRDLRAGTDV